MSARATADPAGRALLAIVMIAAAAGFQPLFEDWGVTLVMLGLLLVTIVAIARPARL